MTTAAPTIPLPAATLSVARARLHPPRSSGRYYILTQLRRAIERLVTEHLAPAQPRLLIDLGCGDMPYRPLIEPHVQRYLGVDLASNSAADMTLDPHGHLDLPDGSADAVLSSQVLEHVPDPMAYLAQAHRLLAPTGLLILSTHGVWKHHPHPLDLWRWTGQGLHETVTRAGFDVVRFDGVLGLAATGMLLVQDGLITRLPRPLRPALATVMQWLIAGADRLATDDHRRRDASVFILLARKRIESAA
jgi:SAM-dependent methyltransferase